MRQNAENEAIHQKALRGEITTEEAIASFRERAVEREREARLAVIMALHTRQVLGYSLADHMPDDLVLSTLRNACYAQPPRAKTLFPSDRGSQYASDDFRDAVDALKMVASMSRRGN